MCYGDLDRKYLARDIEARIAAARCAGSATRVSSPAFAARVLSWSAVWGGQLRSYVVSMRRLVQFSVALALVTGCVDPASSVAPEIPRNTPLPADLQRDVFDAATAIQIARNCPTKFFPNMRAIKPVGDRAEAEAKRRGLSRPTTTETLAVMGGERATQDKVIDYIQRRGILFNQPSTWCAAGQRELAEKSTISRYLVLRQ